MTVRNRAALATTRARGVALSCVEAGVAAAAPERAIGERVALDGDRLVVDGVDDSRTTDDLAAHDEVVVLGAGKPAGRVAAALEGVLGDRLAGGVVVAPEPAATDRVTVRTGEHPLPGAGSRDGAEAVLAAARAAGSGDDGGSRGRAGPRALVLGVVGGGASALLAAPAGDLTLPDLRATTEGLLAAGASIHEVNAVRKHLSAVKGGRLARAAHPAAVAVLVFSDVVGDDAGVVGSGPFAPDGSTDRDALAVLDRYDPPVPGAVREHLRRGVAGDHPETPGPGDPCFERVAHHVLADGFTALAGARAAAVDRGYEPVVLSSRVRGEAREAAPTHVAVGEECRATGTPAEPPAVVLAGGETTVTVRGDGVGGPNQEFALAAALEFGGVFGRGGAGERDGRDVALASVDTDGRDGGTDAAGALVDGATVDGGSVDDVVAARAALADNDSHSFLEARDALVFTGPTGTNVNDLRVLVVE